MRVRVRVFGIVEDAVGSHEIQIDIHGGATLRDLIALLLSRFPKLSQIIDENDPLQSLVVLINGRNVEHLPSHLDTELRNGDLVVLVPLAPGG